MPDIVGVWRLKTWRQVREDGSTSYPFGQRPTGLLIYAPDGNMAVQMLTTERPSINTDDPLGGSPKERADAYSTCLAYFGTYELRGQEVIHRVEASLFPNWSKTVQARPFISHKRELVLQVNGENGRLTSEIIWERKGV